MWVSVRAEQPTAFNWRWVTSRGFGGVLSGVYIENTVELVELVAI
jgi:hypothetical protein